MNLVLGIDNCEHLQLLKYLLLTLVYCGEEWLLLRNSTIMNLGRFSGHIVLNSTTSVKH